MGTDGPGLIDGVRMSTVQETQGKPRLGEGVSWGLGEHGSVQHTKRHEVSQGSGTAAGCFRAPTSCGVGAGAKAGHPHPSVQIESGIGSAVTLGFEAAACEDPAWRQSRGAQSRDGSTV